MNRVCMVCMSSSPACVQKAHSFSHGRDEAEETFCSAPILVIRRTVGYSTLAACGRPYIFYVCRLFACVREREGENSKSKMVCG